ncbi:larval cuticle protein LCP-22-like [Epargyreus clarus]|uniref:larval cuticle protein LCP-22-like n=1 Tax=Epargyreus clarus TaxID=520877 RepID=UPI003C2BBF4A
MKTIVIAVLVLAVIELSQANDDGKYDPAKYGDEGKYRGVQDGQYYDRYRNFYGRDNSFYRYNPYYSQQYHKTLTPYQQYLNRIEQEASVTSRPPAVVSTARPIVYTPSTAVPIYRDQYNNEHYARIVSQESDANENSYHYKYLTENGISADESGVVDTVNGGTRVSGFYEYVGDNGLTYRVDYTADENGFHPTGAHLP